MHFSLVVSKWNSEITETMYTAALEVLQKSGCPLKNIYRIDVPGSFEIPLGAKLTLDKQKPDAVICIGCVIQGETRHFDFICHPLSSALMHLGLEYNKPVIFGILTTENMHQAVERSGGKHGNKGSEAAVTAIRMVFLKKQLDQQKQSG